MSTGIDLDLPWPPSVNNYWVEWGEWRGGKIVVRKGVGQKGSDYRATVLRLKLERRIRTLEGRLQIRIQGWKPDRRKRDMDNPLKALLDALEYAKIVEDDEQFDDIHVTSNGVESPGRLIVTITPINGC